MAWTYGATSAHTSWNVKSGRPSRHVLNSFVHAPSAFSPYRDDQRPGLPLQPFASSRFTGESLVALVDSVSYFQPGMAVIVSARPASRPRPRCALTWQGSDRTRVGLSPSPLSAGTLGMVVRVSPRIYLSVSQWFELTVPGILSAPEKGQAFGTRAKQAASDLAFGKDVTLRTHGKDKYGRTLADVLLPDGMNLNQKLVKQGWC